MFQSRTSVPGHLILLLLLVSPLIAAQPGGGPYTLRKQAIGSGIESTGGSFRLIGTVAEPGAGTLDAPALRLTGGFHGTFTGAVVGDRIFCDGFETTGCN